jgi:hypothetical protein
MLSETRLGKVAAAALILTRIGNYGTSCHSLLCARKEHTDKTEVPQKGVHWPAVVSTVVILQTFSIMNLRVPKKAQNFVTCCAAISLSAGTLLRGGGLKNQFCRTNYEDNK